MGQEGRRGRGHIFQGGGRAQVTSPAPAGGVRGEKREMVEDRTTLAARAGRRGDHREHVTDRAQVEPPVPSPLRPCPPSPHAPRGHLPCSQDGQAPPCTRGREGRAAPGEGRRGQWQPGAHPLPDPRSPSLERVHVGGTATPSAPGAPQDVQSHVARFRAEPEIILKPVMWPRAPRRRWVSLLSPLRMLRVGF